MKKTFTIILTLIASLSLFSCMTMKDISSDLSPTQILQLGQNASSSGSYKNATYCFNTVIERFGDDPYILVQAKYELGHIFMKKKKYDKAKVIFNEVLAIYSSYPTQVPPKFKKLANMGLEQIEEKTAPKIRKSKKSK